MENKNIFEMPKPKVVDDIIVDKDNLLNYSWLFGSVPWANHDNECIRYSFYNKELTAQETVDVFIIHLNGLEPILKKITCDSVIVTGWHGTITTYFFDFYNGEEKVGYADFHSFAYSEEDIKKLFIEYLEGKIKGLEWQINNQKTIIEKIEGLHVLK